MYRLPDTHCKHKYLTSRYLRLSIHCPFQLLEPGREGDSPDLYSIYGINCPVPAIPSHEKGGRQRLRLRPGGTLGRPGFRRRGPSASPSAFALRAGAGSAPPSFDTTRNRTTHSPNSNAPCATGRGWLTVSWTTDSILLRTCRISSGHSPSAMAPPASCRWTARASDSTRS